MTPEQQQEFINRFMGSATDAFTNQRMKTILLQLAGGSSVVSAESYEDFELLYTTYPDRQWVAVVAIDEKYGNDGVEYKYIPGLGVMLAGLELVEPIEDGN